MSSNKWPIITSAILHIIAIAGLWQINNTLKPSFEVMKISIISAPAPSPEKNSAKDSFAEIMPVKEEIKQPIIKENAPPKKEVVQKKIAPQREVKKQEVVQQNEIMNQIQPSAAISGNENNNPAENLSYSPPIFSAAYLENPPPNYPSIAKRRGIEGVVELEVLVADNGRAKSVTIKQSSGHTMLDKAAIAAVEKWRFSPAKRGNKEVEAKVIVPIEFKMG